jgi:hypothetical protein
MCVLAQRQIDLVASRLEGPIDCGKALQTNEWAPVQSSSAGPYIFVLSEGFLLVHQNDLRI